MEDIFNEALAQSPARTKRGHPDASPRPRLPSDTQYSRRTPTGLTPPTGAMAAAIKQLQYSKRREAEEAASSRCAAYPHSPPTLTFGTN